VPALTTFTLDAGNVWVKGPDRPCVWQTSDEYWRGPLERLFAGHGRNGNGPHARAFRLSMRAVTDLLCLLQHRLRLLVAPQSTRERQMFTRCISSKATSIQYTLRLTMLRVPHPPQWGTWSLFKMQKYWCICMKKPARVHAFLVCIDVVVPFVLQSPHSPIGLSLDRRWPSGWRYLLPFISVTLLGTKSRLAVTHKMERERWR